MSYESECIKFEVNRLGANVCIAAAAMAFRGAEVQVEPVIMMNDAEVTA